MNLKVIAYERRIANAFGAASDVNSRLTFQKNLQTVTNKIHATSKRDEIMLEVSADICTLFNADRLTIYTVGEDKQTIVSKVKTGLNSFKESQAADRRTLDRGLRRIVEEDAQPEGRVRRGRAQVAQPEPALPAGSRQAHRLSHQADAGRARWRKPGSSELVGVVQLINNRAGVPFGQLPRRGWRNSARRWPSRFKQRQKAAGPQDEVRLFW